MLDANSQRFRWLGTVLPESGRRRIVIITGARQTGKTTLARKRYGELRYINLDALESRDGLREVSTFGWADTVGNAILDEAQKLPEVFEKLKYAYDEGGVTFSVLLGSSQIMLLKGIRETLAGRAFIYELWPLMPSELLHSETEARPPEPMLSEILKCNSLDRCLDEVPESLIAEEADRRRRAEEHLLRWGGMPELLSLSEEERGRWLRSYEYTYLERDLGDLAQLSDLDPFRRLQRLASLRSGGLLSYSELARDAGISPDTARRYVDYLRISYQALLVPPFYRNLTSTVVKSPKLYWVDSGILRSLSGFRGEATGEVFESYVMSEIHKWVRTVGRDVRIFFYRTRSGLELDGIIETENGILGLEIKLRESVHDRDVRAMRDVAAALGSQWLGGLIVYRGDRVFRFAEPAVWAIPSYRLFA